MRINAPPFKALVPDLGKGAAFDPHEEHGGAHDAVQRQDEEPDEPLLEPSLRQPEEGQGEGCLAPGGGEHREEASKDGDERHLGEVLRIHVVEVLAVVEADANRGGGCRDAQGDLVHVV